MASKQSTPASSPRKPQKIFTGTVPGAGVMPGGNPTQQIGVTADGKPVYATPGS